MAFQFVAKALTGSFQKFAADNARRVAKASREAVRAAADQLQTDGRANIASAGFGKKWQGAFRSRMFDGGDGNIRAMVYSKISYSNVFEKGLTIRGKPLMWIPTKACPPKIGTKRTTPELYRQKYGPDSLRSARAKHPMLIGVPPKRKGRPKKGDKGKAPKAVPMFIGVPSVTDPRKLNIAGAAKKARDDLPRLYAEKFLAGG